MNPHNWLNNTVSASTWTDLVNEASPVVIKSLCVSAGANAANVKVQITDSGGSALFTVIPGAPIGANSGTEVNAKAITLQANQKLQVWADATAVEFAAFGAL